jgi:ribosomal protein L29
VAKKRLSEEHAELHRMSVEEIGVELVRLRKRLCDLRTQAATEKIEDPSEFGKTRKAIARLMTERTRREKSEAAA